MFVREFYAQAKTMFASCSEAEIFSRLSDAAKLLANKGINDPLLGEIEVQSIEVKGGAKSEDMVSMASALKEAMRKKMKKGEYEEED